MNAERILDGIIAVINSNLKDIAEAQAVDGEVDAAGNSYNSSEAGGYFHAFVDEINQILPEDQQIEFPTVEADEEDPQDPEDE